MPAVINYNERKITKYKGDLKSVASISNLFSDSDTPLIYYRATENIYCECFKATNVSRHDSTADAILGDYGIGVKTFIRGARFQKIAEFDKQRRFYNSLTGIDLVREIARLRNERIETTKRTYQIHNLIYHCVVRSEGHIDVYEELMHEIDINNIRIVSDEPTKIKFQDGIETYEFYLSKSTLFKLFDLHDPMISMDVEILENPMDMLRRLSLAFRLQGYDREMHYSVSPNGTTERLIIPLYSIRRRGRPDEERFVALRSGLNQWHARGRPRNANEVYIPYPAKIRKECPTFFPDRNTAWNLTLPNGNVISMKVCQDGSKALMSSPNSALGRWLLRQVLNVNEGEVLTYERLLEIGIDSVVFTKHNGRYSIDFIDSDYLED